MLLSVCALRGVAGLVFQFQYMSRGHESHRLFFFLNLINQEIRTKYWNAVSGWRSVIAVLLKVGCGARLICTCTQHTPRLCMRYCFVTEGCGPTKSNRLDKAHARDVCV